MNFQAVELKQHPEVKAVILAAFPGIAELEQCVASLAAKIEAAVRQDYPGLLRWKMAVPGIYVAVKADNSDGFVWRKQKRTYAERCQRYLSEAVQVTACRISEAYGTGEGSAWARRHFSADGDERMAISQTVASVESVIR